MNKRLVTIAVGSVLAAGVGASAHAVEVKLSGQVNRALMMVDDGTNTETHHVDNDISSTRFRFVGSEEVMPGLKAGVTFEVEMQSNPSNDVTQTDKGISPDLDERQINVFFQGGFGKVIIGQAPGAADGGTEVDLSGTDVVQGALGAHALGGAITFMTTGGVAGPALEDSINNQDFESRYDLLRYETPAFGPVKLALSSGVNNNDNDVREAALLYSGELGGGKLAATLGFSRENAVGSDDETVGGSISWLLPSGLNFTFATSTRDAPDRDREFTYFKVGYKTGNHAVGIDLAMGDDQNAAGQESEMVGVGYVYKPAKWAELYAGAKVHSLDAPANYEDITVVTVGSRLKF